MLPPFIANPIVRNEQHSKLTAHFYVRKMLEDVSKPGSFSEKNEYLDFWSEKSCSADLDGVIYIDRHRLAVEQSDKLWKPGKSKTISVRNVENEPK